MVEILFFLLLVLLLVGLAFTVLVDSYISKEHRNVMLVIVALSLGVIVRDWFDIDETNRLVRTFVAVYG